MSKEVIKNTELNKLNMKGSNLGNKIHATTLIHINQYNTDKKGLEKYIEDIDKKIPDVISLVSITILKTKVGEAENKIPDSSSLVANNGFNTKIG